jgi:hypothetical protein
MRPKKYPLEPLRRLKKDRAGTKTRELGAAIVTREKAQKRREEAEVEREAERARADRVRGEELAALEKGELFARDLARGGAWEQRTSAEDAERARGVEKARSTEQESQAAEAKAQGSVAVARAEVEATARHEQRFWSAVRKAEESREEDAVAEVRPSVRAEGYPQTPGSKRSR